jgi:hypothetical protein
MHSLISQFPHCDQRILHKPGACSYCDGHPLWQQLRDAWGVAFTGEAPVGDQVPCPADYARPPSGDADHRRWGGNRAPASDPWWNPDLVDARPFGVGMIERLGARVRRGGRWKR